MEPMKSDSLNRTELLYEIEQLSPWGQSIHMMADVHTPGPLDTNHRWNMLKSLPIDFKDKTVIDAGCNAGFFSFKAEELGAKRVLGIDCDHYIDQAKFIEKFKQTKTTEFKVCSVFDPPKEEFQVSLVMGLLYHLKFPFLAVEKLAKITTETMIIETEALASSEDTKKMLFVEHTFRNDDSSWWIPGEECLKGFLRSCGFPYVKAFYFPQTPENPFGFHYSTGKTVEGFPSSQRIMIIARRFINSDTESFFNELPNVPQESSYPTTVFENSKPKDEVADENSTLDQAPVGENFYWEEVNEYKRTKVHLEQKNSELVDYTKILEQERSTWKDKNTELVDYIEILEQERNSWKEAHEKLVNLINSSNQEVDKPESIDEE